MKHLEEVIINYDKKLMKAELEIERLNNIINELEEWLSYEWYKMSKDINPEEVLDKLKELKGSGKSEK